MKEDKLQQALKNLNKNLGILSFCLAVFGRKHGGRLRKVCDDSQLLRLDAFKPWATEQNIHTWVAFLDKLIGDLGSCRTNHHIVKNIFLRCAKKCLQEATRAADSLDPSESKSIYVRRYKFWEEGNKDRIEYALQYEPGSGSGPG